MQHLEWLGLGHLWVSLHSDAIAKVCLSVNVKKFNISLTLRFLDFLIQTLTPLLNHTVLKITDVIVLVKS